MIPYITRQARERIATALAALETPPTETELAAAPLLEGWAPATMINEPVLIGRVHGHPVVNGEVMTSTVIMIDTERGIARTLSRWYRLGCPISEAEPDLVEKLERKRPHLALVYQSVFDTTVTAYRTALSAILAAQPMDA